MFCTNCGKKVTDDAKFCSECGYQLDKDDYINNETEEMNKTCFSKKNNDEVNIDDDFNKKFVIGLFIVVGIFFAYLAFPVGFDAGIASAKIRYNPFLFRANIEVSIFGVKTI